MSLVLTWFSPDCIGIVSDGRSSKRNDDGSLSPVSEDCSKFCHLHPRIVIACTGLQEFFVQQLFTVVKAFADTQQDYPELFEELAAFVPTIFRSVHGFAKKCFKECDGAVMLLGYDALQQRMRDLVFLSQDGFAPIEETQAGGYAIGNGVATKLSMEIFASLMPETPQSVDSILPTLEGVANLVSDAVPSVNRNLRYALLLPPEMQADVSLKGPPSKHVDIIPDGSTFGRPILTRLNGGKPLIDFSEAIHLNKNLDNLPDGSGRFSVVNGAGLKAVSSVDGANKALIDFSQGGHTNKNLDNVADGTRAAWLSTTQRTVAVDTSGNILLKNLVGPSPVTVAPTTSSNTYSVIPEMTATITTKGNKVLLVFSGSFFSSTSLAVGWDIAFFRDGTKLSGDFGWGTTDTQAHLIAVSYLDAPSAGSHTYDVRWVSNSGSTLTVGFSRTFQIVELG